MKLKIAAFAITSLMFASQFVHAGGGQGKALIDKHCTRCHGSSVYTRPDRQVRSLNALHQRVKMCEKPASVNWSGEELESVVNYLNKEFYRFK